MDVPAHVAKNAAERYLAMFRKCVEHPGMSLDQWRICLWMDALGELFENLADDIYLKWKQFRYRNLQISDSVIAMLKLLRKRYQLALVTNGPSCSQWEKIRELNLEGYFDAIIVSGDLEYEKPQPELFQYVFSSLRVQPFECLIIGDNLDTDIKGGIASDVGLTVWLSPERSVGLNRKRPKPDIIIRDVLELTEILDEKLFPMSSYKRRNSRHVDSNLD